MRANVSTHQASKRAAVRTGLRALATRTGCTLSRNPMPELRAVGREWRRAAGATRR